MTNEENSIPEEVAEMIGSWVELDDENRVVAVSSCKSMSPATQIDISGIDPEPTFMWVYDEETKTFSPPETPIYNEPEIPPEPTFEWEGKNLTYNSTDINSVIKMKAWFEFGGAARDMTFSNGETVNISDLAELTELAQAGMAAMAADNDNE